MFSFFCFQFPKRVIPDPKTCFFSFLERVSCLSVSARTPNVFCSFRSGPKTFLLFSSVSDGCQTCFQFCFHFSYWSGPKYIFCCFSLRPLPKPVFLFFSYRLGAKLVFFLLVETSQHDKDSMMCPR